MNEYDPPPVTVITQKQFSTASSPKVYDGVTVKWVAHRVIMECAVLERSLVTVQVHSVSGKKVATLVDKLIISGHPRITWNTDGIPVGIYFAGITAGKHFQVKRLTMYH